MKKINFILGLSSILLVMLVVGCGKTTTQGTTTTTTTQSSTTTTTTTQSSTTTTTTKPTTTTTQSTTTTTAEGIPEDELTVYVEAGKDLKVVQFADIHFGTETASYHNGKVEQTKVFMQHVVDTVQPDLIILSGDNIMHTGPIKLKELCEFIDTFETPWTFLWGNHDEEMYSTSRKSTLSTQLNKYESDYLLYKNGYVDKENIRYGNFSISIREKETDRLLGGLIIFDTGVYNYTLAAYENITPGQVDWYNEEIDRLQRLYSKQENNQQEIIPTIIFQHMHIIEFAKYYEEALADPSKFVVSHTNMSAAELSMYSGVRNEKTGLYEAILEKQSTKAVFVGHMHTLRMQYYTEHGILFGFAPQTGYSNGFLDDDKPRRTYAYSLNNVLDIKTEEVNEPVLQIDKNYTEIKLEDSDVLNYTIENYDGEVTYDVDAEGIVNITKNEDNSFTIEGVNVGYVNITFKAKGAYSRILNVYVKSGVFTLYDRENNVIADYTSVYKAINYLYQNNMTLGYITIKGLDEKIYIHNKTYDYSFIDNEGKIDEFDSNSKVTDGKAKTWSTMIKNLRLATQEYGSALHKSGTYDWRPADFDAFGGYDEDGNPNYGNGWLESLYKSGTTVAQYVGYDLENAGNMNTVELAYDLSNSVLVPSSNDDQSNRADIWIGQTNVNSNSIAPYIFGITFDTGTLSELNELENGTTRGWYLFYEKLNLDSSKYVTAVEGSRTLDSEPIAYATWNKELSIWETNFEVIISLKYLFSDENNNENFKNLLTVTINENTRSLELDYESIQNRGIVRYSYGLNFTPVLHNGNIVKDLNNGGSWSNVVLTSAKGLQDNTIIKENMKFEKTRDNNGAKFTGIYGSDNLSAAINDDKVTFKFSYIFE